MTSSKKIPKRFDGPTKFPVRIIKENKYMEVGLAFHVISETKHLYHGLETGMGGSYFVTVPKKYCEQYDPEEFTRMIADAVKHSHEHKKKLIKEFEEFADLLRSKDCRVELSVFPTLCFMLDVWYKDKFFVMEGRNSAHFGYDELTKEDCGFNTGYHHIAKTPEEAKQGLLELMGI